MAEMGFHSDTNFQIGQQKYIITVALYSMFIHI